MNAFFPLASLGKFSSPGVTLLFGLELIFIVMVLVVGTIVLVVSLVRRGTSRKVSASLEDRLRKLDALRRTDSISEDEHAQQRRRILAEV